MAIVYRTAGGWGAGKGSNLTAAEVDENFYDHEGRIATLESTPPEPNNIDSIDAVGSQITITMEDASTFGPFTIPTARFTWVGDWADATSYSVNDVFTDADTGNIYVVIKAHTSAAPFDAAATSGGDPVYDLMIDSTSIAGAVGGGLGGFSSYVSHSSSTLTIDEDDANVFYILETASNDITITVPADSTSFDLPVGTTIGFVKNHDLNTVVMSAASGFFGAADANETIRRVGSVFYIRKTDDDEWTLYGDLDKHANVIKNDTGTGTVNITWSTYARKTWVMFNAGSGVTYDLRTDAQEPKWQIGAELGFIQLGAGQMTFTCSGGTLNKISGTTPISNAAGSWVRLIKTAADTWTIIGDYS